MPAEGEFWSVADCARHLEMSGEGVRAAARSGRLKVALRLPGGQRLFRPPDVRQFGREREGRSRRRLREEA